MDILLVSHKNIGGPTKKAGLLSRYNLVLDTQNANRALRSSLGLPNGLGRKMGPSQFMPAGQMFECLKGASVL